MSFPDFTFWSHLLETFGVEVCCLAAFGLLAQRFFRSAVWQRAVWQMIVICLLLLPASEWTGFGRGAAGFLFGRKPVVESAPPTGFTVFKSATAVAPMAVELNRPPVTLRPAVWWPAWIWLTGAALVLGRMAMAQVLLLALRLRREKIATQSLRQRVANVARSVGLRRQVSLLRMPESISPMAFGILRPSIGLPPGFEAKLSMTEQEAVLAHELAHLAAMDPLWFLLADFASALLWWHPLTWWVRHSLHNAAELAADEATAMVPDGPGALANCLVSLGKEMTAARGWSWVGINGGFRSSLGRRVERLMRMSAEVERPLAGWLGAAAKLAATILIVPTVVLFFGSFQSAHAQKEETWRGQLRESWNVSPGALLLLAALDTSSPPASNSNVSTIPLQTNQAQATVNQPLHEDSFLTNAKLALQTLDKATNDIEARNKEKQEIAFRVTGGKLLYEMGQLDESEAVFVAVVKEDPSNRSAAYYLDLIKEARYTRANGKAERALSAIGIKSLPLPVFDTNLVYTIKGRQQILAKLESIMLDEVNYDLPLKDVLLELKNESRKRDPDGIGVPFMINEGTDAAVGARPPFDVGQVRIKISPPLRNLRLADVLDAITKVAESPIRYTVEDYAVVFAPKPADSIPSLELHTKTFRVDPNTFIQGLEEATGVKLGQTNTTVEAHQLAASYFASNGVNLTPPKALFFNDRLGELLVRASLQDLEIIQQAIEALNQTPPQVTIEARFVEVDEAALKGISLDWNKSAQDVTGVKTDPSLRVALSTERVFTGLMTDKQFRLTLSAIENRFGADVLEAAKVTTESGRQARVGSSKGDNVVTLDVIPVVGPDGYLIQIAAIPTIKVNGQTWQVKASRQILDGDTMAVGQVMSNQPSGPRKVRVVFITPTIIDPAGNRLHTDDDLSKSLEILNP